MAASGARTQLAVVGAGPGGYAAAFLAADLGLDVTLVDPEPRPGGVCLYRGCIPSKALLHAAKLLGDARAAESMGIHFGAPRVDVERLRAWKDEVVEKLTSGLGRLASGRKIECLRGRARLEDAHTLRVEESGGGERRLAFEQAVLATGSRPSAPPGVEFGERVLDSSSALELPEVPGRLLVVGGGYIGLEMGSVYAELGSRVTVVEMTKGLLPGVDPDLVRPLAHRLEGLFEEVHLGTRVASLEPIDRGVRVALEGAKTGTQDYERVLVAVGRRPNSEELGLETTKAVVRDDGTVEVDAARRTAEPSLFAIGDLAGEPMLAHKATHEGRVAARAAAGEPAVFEPRAIPCVVFTDPEVAWCGLTERAAKQQGRSVAAARFPWSASGRALTLGRTDGLTKLVVDPESERVLGMGVCGPGAGELIAEGVLAVEMGAVASDLGLSIHPHPTLTETVMEAAEVHLGHPTHVARPRARGGRGG